MIHAFVHFFVSLPGVVALAALDSTFVSTLPLGIDAVVVILAVVARAGVRALRSLIVHLWPHEPATRAPNAAGLLPAFCRQLRCVRRLLVFPCLVTRLPGFLSGLRLRFHFLVRLTLGRCGGGGHGSFSLSSRW